MKITLKKELPLILISILPLIYLAYVWNLLPTEVPTHYNFKGDADRFSSKTSFAILIIAMNVISYITMLVLPYIDPKKQIEHMGNKFYHIKFISIALVTSLSLFIIYKIIYPAVNIQFLMVIIGLFFIALGNYFQTIKQNYVLGIRTPWTLHSEEVWKKTHKLSGKIWMLGGLFLMLTYFILPLNISSVLNIVVVIVMVLIPFVYSFFLYKKSEKAD